jgi:hypothetical protein
MAKLIISRKNELMNWARAYKIFLNGKQINSISSGETLEIEIPEGSNTVKVKINWLGSQNLTLTVNKAEELKYVSISGLKILHIIFRLMSLITLVIIIFRQLLKTNFPFLVLPIKIFALLLILAWLYYMTIGKNKCIILKAETK